MLEVYWTYVAVSWGIFSTFLDQEGLSCVTLDSFAVTFHSSCVKELVSLQFSHLRRRNNNDKFSQHFLIVPFVTPKIEQKVGIGTY